MGPCFRRDDQNGYLPALVPLKGTSSSKDDDTEGACSPSEAREIATRVLLKTVSAPASLALRLLSSSATSTLYGPLESSATLPGVADDRISALSGAMIGARPWEKARNRRSYGLRREASMTTSLVRAPRSLIASSTDSTLSPSRRTSVSFQILASTGSM